jgi:predicted AAA+ superfamily ATPase
MVVLTGPRQVGKTTLARALMPRFAQRSVPELGHSCRPRCASAPFMEPARACWCSTVKGDDGVRFENAVATMLLKQVHWRQDTQGMDAGLHYVRTKDGAEVDFCLSQNHALTQLVECKLADAQPHRALVRFAAQFPLAEAVQLVRDLRQPEAWRGVQVERAAEWLARLSG